MLNYFYEGGPFFMGILTLILFILILVFVADMLILFRGSIRDELKIKERLSMVKSVGLMGLVIGIFGQLIGLYEAFGAIQEIGDVSPALLAGGLRVSLITTLYGISIFILSYVFWFILLAYRSNTSAGK